MHFSVSSRFFSGEQVLEFWPIVFGSADASEAFGCCASSDDSGTLLQPPPTLQQRYYRACVPGPLPPLIQSSLQNSMAPAKPLEILAEEAIRTVCRWTGGVRNGHRSRGQSSGRGTTSRRRVMSLASSTSQWAFDDLHLFLDVGIHPDTLCPAYLGYQKTLPAHTSNTS